MDNNTLIRDIIISQKDFHLLPRDADGYCYFGGDLFLSNCKLKYLPNNLKILGELYCSYNELKHLPDNLKLGSDLFCSGNKLTSIPDGLDIKGNLFCSGNNIIKEIKCNIGGKIIMGDDQRKVYNRIIKLNRIKANIDG